MPNTTVKVEHALMLLVLFIYFSLVGYSATYARGTDQYWYEADVETLVTNSANTTNNVYPVALLDPNSDIPRPFIHNILNIYFVGPFASLFGPFYGWVIANSFATLCTAFLIYLLVLRFTDRWSAIFAFIAYMLMPITIWQTPQPLAESTINAVVVLAIIVYVYANESPWRWLLLTVITGIAFYCRDNFLLILMFIPVAYLLHTSFLKKKTLSISLGLCAVIALLIVMKPLLLPLHNPCHIGVLLNYGLPGGSDNMECYFSLTKKPVTLDILWSKLAASLKMQILPDDYRSAILFYMPYNLLALFAISLNFSAKSNYERRLAFAASALILLHIVTIVVVQNQFRYQYFVYPALICCGGLFLYSIKKLKSRSYFIITLGLLFLLICVDLPLANKLHNEGLQNKELGNKLERLFNKIIPESDNVLLAAEGNGSYIHIGYILRPRLVMMLRPVYRKEIYEQLREKIEAKWLFSPLNSKLIDNYKISSTPILQNLPYPYDNYGLFAIIGTDR